MLSQTNRSFFYSSPSTSERGNTHPIHALFITPTPAAARTSLKPFPQRRKKTLVHPSTLLPSPTVTDCLSCRTRPNASVLFRRLAPSSYSALPNYALAAKRSMLAPNLTQRQPVSSTTPHAPPRGSLFCSRDDKCTGTTLDRLPGSVRSTPTQYSVPINLSSPSATPPASIPPLASRQPAVPTA